ncbi:MAG: hypothetical protein AB7O65_02965 [Candidatus Korobacteraceae bacterium]
MSVKRILHFAKVVAVVAGLAALPPALNSQAVSIDADDIGGVVTSTQGPEAGVWVIAETTDLPTRLIKTVVTDDQGRYVLPDLPKAQYDVWVRGYGLVDSPKVKAQPGKALNLTAKIAPSEKEAAQYYPAGYWYSMLKVPEKSEFPGTGPSGNGINPNMKSQGMWLRTIKTDSCQSCHQLGNKATRTIPDAFEGHATSAEAWQRRVQSGQAGTSMMGGLSQLGMQRATKMFGDWTDRIAAGELPKEKPSRPQGVERNVVVTQWDFATPTAYLHDVISTDRRNPTVNANGPIIGALELSHDYIPVVDPKTNTASQVPIPVRDPKTQPASGEPLKPSAYWGEEAIWDSKANVHNPMMDHKARWWFTSTVRPRENPAFCREGSSHPSAKLTPVENAGRHLSMYDPSKKEWKLISTCYSTHHLFFGEDANHTLWTSGAGVLGWLNTKMYDETGDEAKSQGWTALVIDYNGNGKRDPYVAANQTPDPQKDLQIPGNTYGVMPAVDGSVWVTILGFPGKLVRMVPGSNPPETSISEVYEPPMKDANTPVEGYSPRGMDIDRNNVVWMPMASGHFASFDRSKCKGPLSGPKATGQHCPEGWKFYTFPGPKFSNVPDSGSVEASYYNWVDQFDTLGMGKNTPIAMGNQSDALFVLDPKTGKFTTLRVPYPMNFYAKGVDGRIDDPKAGWKGKGLWTTYGTRTPFHGETGKGTLAKVVHFQLRPNPLAK